MCLLHGHNLLATHLESLVVGTGEPHTLLELGDDGPNISDRAPHPLKLMIVEALRLQSGTNIVVSERGTIVTLGQFV